MQQSPLFNVVLVEPEIPQHTGNSGRTCVGFQSHLHLVGTLGFDLDDKKVKRAGLDYWPHLNWTHHVSWEDWWDVIPDKSRVFFMSTKAQNSLYEAQFQDGDWLVFGKETKGLDEAILNRYPEQCFKIPFLGSIRSFNLSNAVAMTLGEGFRQTRHK